MRVIDLAQPVMDFMERNQTLTIFLTAMAIVGFALYVVLQAVRRSTTRCG